MCLVYHVSGVQYGGWMNPIDRWTLDVRFDISH